MGKDKAFDANEIGIADQCRGKRGAVGAAENLNAQGQAGRAADLPTDSSHGRHDLRADLSFQVRPIVHVLDHQAVETGISELMRVCHCRFTDLVDGELAVWCTWQGLYMDHSNQSPPHSKDRGDDLSSVHDLVI